MQMLTIKQGEKTHQISHVEHMVHHKNIENVLIHGLLSHNEAYKLGLIKEDISLSEVQERRKNKRIKVDDKLTVTIHDLVSFYFNSKNPMLYKRKGIKDELVIVLINSDIIDSKRTDEKFAIFSDGNAGSSSTKFFIGLSMQINIF